MDKIKKESKKERKNKGLKEEKGKTEKKFFNHDTLVLISLSWFLVFFILQFSIIIVAGPDSSFFNFTNLGIITTIIISILVIIFIPFIFKIANDRIATTFSSFDIEPSFQDEIDRARTNMRKKRILTYVIYSVLFFNVLVLIFYTYFKGTEESFETEFMNMLSDVLLTNDFNIYWGTVLYILYILIFILLFTYLFVSIEIFFFRINAVFIPILLNRIKKVDTFNGDNSMGFGDLGDIVKMFIFAGSSVFIICLPGVVLSYTDRFTISSVLDMLVFWISGFALAWLWYMYLTLKPVHKKMKDSKQKLMIQIVKEINTETEKLISSDSSVQTKKLENFLELRKQLINVRTWPISSTLIIVFISQLIALVIALISWIISSII